MRTCWNSSRRRATSSQRARMAPVKSKGPAGVMLCENPFSRRNGKRAAYFSKFVRFGEEQPALRSRGIRGGRGFGAGGRGGRGGCTGAGRRGTRPALLDPIVD